MGEIGIGIIGAGRWARQHIAAIQKTPGAKLVALAARSPETAAQAGAEFGVPIFTDYQEMLARPEVEAVIVAAPNYLHYPLGKAALEAGKHTLVEKPMALHTHECDDVIAAAQTSGKVLYIGHEFRGFAIWGKVKELLAQGAIGTPKFGDIQLWRYPYRSGAGGWKQDPAKVGNWLLEEPVHYFDLVSWFLSHTEPRSIYARASSRTPDKEQIFENFSALVDFKDGSYVNITRIITAYDFEISIRFTGTEGVLKASWKGEVDISLNPQVSITLYQYEDKVEREIEVTKQTGHAFELPNQTAAFLKAIETGQPFVSGQDGRKAVMLCEAALESLKTNKVVSC